MANSLCQSNRTRGGEELYCDRDGGTKRDEGGETLPLTTKH